MRQVTIAAQFVGPVSGGVGSGNGGYVAGVVAGLLGAACAEVNLRRRAPLDTPLAVQRGSDHAALLDVEGEVVAEARPAALALTPPGMPAREEAAAGSAQFRQARWSHTQGTCFCCGDSRPDALAVLTGARPGHPGQVAALWTPAQHFASADGLLPPEYLWAALDCGGAFACTSPEPPRSMLLARFVARLEGRVRAGEECRVLGWRIGEEGRKRFAGTALWGADGRLVGVAEALWVVPRPPA